MTNSTSTTLDDVIALSNANSVAFHHHAGNAWITACISRSTYSARDKTLFPEPGPAFGERGRVIACGSAIYGYTVDGHAACAWSHRDSPNAECSYMVRSARFHEPWKTVASLLRKGDRLTLSWTADNNTGVVRAGLHADDLKLVIDRGDWRMTFIIAHSVTPDDSARMVRRTG